MDLGENNSESNSKSKENESIESKEKKSLNNQESIPIQFEKNPSLFRGQNFFGTKNEKKSQIN